jgi:hypothetical protein
MSNSENEWRDRVLKECAKLLRIFVASPNAPIASPFSVGHIQKLAETLGEADLITQYGEVRKLIERLRQEPDGQGGMVLNRDREQLLTDDPRCPTHGMAMKWKTVPNVKTGWSEPAREIRLFRCPTCDVVLWDGRIQTLDEQGNFGPLS